MIQLLDQTGVVEIAEIQIQPSHQRRGIGGRILRDIVNQAHKRGKSVTLFMALKNERAYRFYQRHGFREVGQNDTHSQLRCEPQ
jgi:ribosomal-protein-alanine N-acetyltransferase